MLLHIVLGIKDTRKEGQQNEKGRLTLDDTRDKDREYFFSICFLTLNHIRANTLVSTNRLNPYKGAESSVHPLTLRLSSQAWRCTC